MNHRTPRHSPRTAAGFTLMEVLVAMGIFTVGMVGIAAVFPVAISLQQAATQEVQAVQAQRNAEALLKGVGVDPLDLYATVNLQVQPVDPSFFDHWTIADRGYPRSLSPADPAGAGNYQAEFYWVPLYRDPDGSLATPDDAIIYLFILARQPNAQYDYRSDQANPDTSDGAPYSDPETVPKVIQSPATKKSGDTSVINIANADDFFRPGDVALGNDGTRYTIREVRANEITVTGIVSDLPLGDPKRLTTLWHAEPAQPGGPNPAVAIVQLDNLVQP